MNASAPCDYSGTNIIRIMLSVSIAQITKDNVAKLKLYISQPFPPKKKSYS